MRDLARKGKRESDKMKEISSTENPRPLNSGTRALSSLIRLGMSAIELEARPVCSIERERLSFGEKGNLWHTYIRPRSLRARALSESYLELRTRL